MKIIPPLNIRLAGSSLNMVGTNLIGGHNLPPALGWNRVNVCAKTLSGQTPMPLYDPANLDRGQFIYLSPTGIGTPEILWQAIPALSFMNATKIPETLTFRGFKWFFRI